MTPPSAYQLLDFGRGRKLERFGPMILDRPAPAAGQAPCGRSKLWKRAHWRFDDNPRSKSALRTGVWQAGPALGPMQAVGSWLFSTTRATLELKRTEFGHLGVFPEHAVHWEWIAEQVIAALANSSARPRVLNLFAYTGGATLCAAAAGGEVTHVDAARNVVAWARRNAQHSGLQDASIRWIAEDALKFVQREIRRGNRYDAVILDPPSYGHGPKKETWKLERDLSPLLAACNEVTAPRCKFLLATCHTTAFDPATLRERVLEQFNLTRRKVLASNMQLSTTDGRTISCGSAIRVE